MGEIKKLLHALQDGDVSDSGLSRVSKWINGYDIAMITAFRSKLKYCRKNETNEVLVKADNMKRNQGLRAALLGLGYGVTKIDGSFVEGFGSEGSKEVKENSYLVVNLKNDPKFFSNLKALGEEYCQDNIFFKYKEDSVGFLYGTNNSPDFGYKKRMNVGSLKAGKESQYMSRVKGRPFHFGDSLGLVLSIRHSLSDTVDLDTWDDLQNSTKYVVIERAKKVLDRLGIEISKV